LEKIPNIFKYSEDFKILPEYNVKESDLALAYAIEKIDGTNIRVTTRKVKMNCGGRDCVEVVRVEKRRNPTRKEKEYGVIQPWYVDADKDNPADQWIFKAVNNTDWTSLNPPDGVFSGEAIGPKIQGNPYKLSEHQVVLFGEWNLAFRYCFPLAPYKFNELKEWIPRQKSHINPNVGIEGLVFQIPTRCGVDFVGKIRVNDFKRLVTNI
jgi:hypothetical protein